MARSCRLAYLCAAASLWLHTVSCTGSTAAEPRPQSLPAPSGDTGAAPVVRATGTVHAVRSLTLRVPQLAQVSGRNPQLTLIGLAPNGSPAKKDGVLAEFDDTAQRDDLREARTKLEELRHQLAEKRAQVDSDAAKRLVQIREAEVELGKAEVQLKKGPVLAEIDRQKNEVKAGGARERLASLQRSHEYRTKAEAAAVRVLELKADRQSLVVERVQSNIDRMAIRAPHDGVVALETVWRSGSMGPPQVGDQVWPNQPLLRVFDPSEMVVEVQVNESDVKVLGRMARARVFLDAYPNASFDATLESASPVATAGLESPVRSFSARFRIAQKDARLLPDLSASLEIDLAGAARP